MARALLPVPNAMNKARIDTLKLPILLGGLGLASCATPAHDQPVLRDAEVDGATGTSDAGTAVTCDASDMLTAASRTTVQCSSKCGAWLTLGEAEAHDCHAVTLDIASEGEQQMVRNTGTLTTDGLGKARSLATQLRGQELPADFGCPGCADDIVASLSLARGGKLSTSRYNLQDVPEQIAAAHTFVQALIDALSRCKSGPLVDVAANCTPKQTW